MSKTIYDCVYYWYDAEQRWIQLAAIAEATVEFLHKRKTDQGFVCVLGSTKIGPPEGPPGSADKKKRTAAS